MPTHQSSGIVVGVLIPLAILSNKEARLTIIANTFGWGPIVGLHIMLPMYLQNITGLAPAVAGLSVLLLAVMLNISAGVTGTILPRRVRYKRIPMIGLCVAIAAVLTMAWRASSLSLWEFEILIFLIGCGFGAMPPLASTTLQNSVSIHTFGSAVATMQFSRNLFATMLLFADKSFAVGDKVCIGNHEGTVEEVGFRSTRLRTRDDSVLILPNSTVAGGTIDNQATTCNTSGISIVHGFV